MVPSSISAGINVRCGFAVEWLVVSTSASDVEGTVMSPILAMVVKSSGLAALNTCSLVPMAAMPVGGGTSMGTIDGGITPPVVISGLIPIPAGCCCPPGGCCWAGRYCGCWPGLGRGCVDMVHYSGLYYGCYCLGGIWLASDPASDTECGSE